MATAKDVESALRAHIVPGKKAILERFFKTGPGQYGEGDVFIGVMVPQQQAIAKEYVDLSFIEIKKLLSSKIHELRLTGLTILTYKFKRCLKSKDAAAKKEMKQIYDFYLQNTKSINNWDLVDLSASCIVGGYLLENRSERKILYRLAVSPNLWERRISIISTHAFIRKDDFDDTLKIAKMLLSDKHDLMHKAVGWMLREVGKRDEKTLLKFLDEYSKKMPRTALRYSIERLDPVLKKKYMMK